MKPRRLVLRPQAMIAAFVLACSPIGVLAEWAVVLSNYVEGKVDQPVYDFWGGVRPTGPDYVAQLYISPNSLSGGYTPIGIPVPFTNPHGPGYFGSSSSVVLLPDNISPCCAGYLVRVWNQTQGATWEVATSKPVFAFGSSKPEYLSFGTLATPRTLGNMGSFLFFDTVPEPPPLIMLGAGAVVFWVLRATANRG